MGRSTFIILILAFIFPIISADTILSILPLEPYVSIILIIPVVLIESIIAYLFINKTYKIKNVGFFRISGIFLLFNIITTAIGWLFLNSGNYFLGIYRGRLIPENLFGIIWSFLLTLIIESGGVYLLIKNKCKKPLLVSLITSLIVNLVSYVLLILFVVLTKAG